MSRSGREGEFDAVRGLLGEPGFGLLGDVHTRPATFPRKIARPGQLS
jgi:hypothetical protein